MMKKFSFSGKRKYGVYPVGHIEIKQDKMIVEVNSEKRAQKFENFLRKNSVSGIKLKSKVIEPIKIPPKGVSGKASESSKAIDPNDHPELKAKMEQMMKAHWDNWIFAKLPALGNQSPIEAAKTQDGRESLEGLLADIERHAVAKPMPGQTPETIQQIRDQLGL